jgi:hypothetical protein
MKRGRWDKDVPPGKAPSKTLEMNPLPPTLAKLVPMICCPSCGGDGQGKIDTFCMLCGGKGEISVAQGKAYLKELYDYIYRINAPYGDAAPSHVKKVEALLREAGE